MGRRLCPASQTPCRCCRRAGDPNPHLPGRAQRGLRQTRHAVDDVCAEGRRSLFLAGKKLTRNYFLASQRTARWEGRRLDPGCLKLTGCRLKSCEGNPCETGETRREPLCAQLWCPVQKLWMSLEARRETRAKQAKPVGFEPPRSLGETRAKQGGPVGNLVQRCTPALALRQETSKKSGPPRDAEEAVGHRKPGCRNRVQNFAETHETLGPCSEPRLWPSWGASPLGERRCV